MASAHLKLGCFIASFLEGLAGADIGLQGIHEELYVVVAVDSNIEPDGEPLRSRLHAAKGYMDVLVEEEAVVGSVGTAR